MRIAHVRERHGPAGAPWRLAAALDDTRWLDLEVARRRLIARDPALAHNQRLFRQPVTTLDAHFTMGHRVDALRAILDGFIAIGGVPERHDEDDDDTILNDWSARDLQREETTVRLGPAKGKDFAITLGPWLVTPDELAECRSGKGFDLMAIASVQPPEGQPIEVGRSSWSEIRFSFGEMLERASADVGLRPGEVIGSGTFGGGCLLEVKDTTLGRWLDPGDEVILEIERLGRLRNPVIGRPTES